MVEQFKIIYRNYGIADRFPDGTIELNKHLDEYPKLKASILQHESKHTSNQKFNRKDLLHDMTVIDQYNQWMLIKFMARHPLSLIQLLPLYYTKRRGWIFDQIAAIFWGVGLLAIILAIYIGVSV